MSSFKKQLAILVALILLLVATVLPVGASDSTTPSPANGVTIHIVLPTGGEVLVTLPIRCGNSC